MHLRKKGYDVVLLEAERVSAGAPRVAMADTWAPASAPINQH